MANTNSISLVASSSQYLSITDANQTGLDLNSDFTIEAWVKLSSQPATDANFKIVSKYNASTNDRSYWFAYRDVAGVKKINVRWGTNGTNGEDHWYTYTLNNNTWYHLAVVVDLSLHSAEFFINGSSVGTDSSGTFISIYNGAADFIIGAHAPGASFFDGLIDEARVWSDIRTATEISDNYQKELTGSEANLVGYWKLNNDLLDETANNNDLTNNNSATFSTDVPFTGTATDNAVFFGCNF